MRYDIFFSISQTPVEGVLPTEAEMFANFFAQVEAADAQGYGTAWIAEAHLSSEVQKGNRRPVIPHWEGEVGLNVDFLQLSHRVFARTSRIETGSAVMNILCNGGPVAHAERVAAFLALHGLDPQERRRLNVGFAAGRFDFNNAATGVRPETDFERRHWRQVKGKIFEQAAQIFVRLLEGEVLAGADIAPATLGAGDFRDPSEWEEARALAGEEGYGCDPARELPDCIELPARYDFEALKIIPQDTRRELMQLVIGSHDPRLQERVNQYAPVQVFNLSITRPDVIEQTHERLARAYHQRGGPWRRGYMPRTTFVFLNAEGQLGPEAQRAAAREEAEAALGAYWRALEGTLDPAKVEKAADNALIGNPQDVAEQAAERFHEGDRLMLWFDFFNHDCDRVVRNQAAWMEQVAPRIAELTQ